MKLLHIALIMGLVGAAVFLIKTDPINLLRAPIPLKKSVILVIAFMLVSLWIICSIFSYICLRAGGTIEILPLLALIGICSFCWGGVINKWALSTWKVFKLES